MGDLSARGRNAYLVNLDDHDAHVLVIFDTPGDPHTEMLITPRDYERFYDKGWVPGVEPTA